MAVYLCDQGAVHGSAGCARLEVSDEMHPKIVPLIEMYRWATWCSCAGDVWTDEELSAGARLGGGLMLLGPALSHIGMSHGIGRIEVVAEVFSQASHLAPDARFAEAVREWTIGELQRRVARSTPYTVAAALCARPVVDDAVRETAGDDDGSGELARSMRWLHSLRYAGRQRGRLSRAAQRWDRAHPREGDEWLVAQGPGLSATVVATAVAAGCVPSPRTMFPIDGALARAMCERQQLYNELRYPLAGTVVCAGPVVDGDGPLLVETVLGLDGVPLEQVVPIARAILAP